MKGYTERKDRLGPITEYLGILQGVRVKYWVNVDPPKGLSGMEGNCVTEALKYYLWIKHNAHWAFQSSRFTFFKTSA